MSNNSLIPIAIVGLGIIAMITVPILVSHLLGKNVKGYECGINITPSGISPYCKCEYYLR